MTSIRKSAVFAFEDEFGEGKPEGASWHRVPPGFYLSHVHTRSTNRVDATGNKKFDFIAYGAYSGQWDLSFNLDYKYLDLLCAVFEEYEPKLEPAGSTGTDFTLSSVPNDAKCTLNATAFDDYSKFFEHFATNDLPTTDRVLYKVGKNRVVSYDTVEKKWLMFETVPDKALDMTYLYMMYRHRGTYSETAVKINDKRIEDLETVLVYKATYGDNKTEYFDCSKYYVEGEKLYDLNGEKMTYAANGKALYRHTFKKCNTKKVPSFTIRQKTLNAMAGGKHGDEILELRGCVLKSIRFSITAGSSQVNVSASGFCVKEEMWLETLQSTDYKQYDGEIVEFACLFKGAATPNNYISLVESAQISIGNNADQIYTTCTPFAPSYMEGKTENALSISIYSNDPTIIKQRLYTGGQDIKQGMAGITSYSDYSYLNSPLCKGLHPMPLLNLVSFNTCRLNEQEPIDEAIKRATRMIDFTIVDCVVKSVSWQRGDGSKIMDQLSSAECYDIYLTVISDVENYKDNTYSRVESPGSS